MKNNFMKNILLTGGTGYIGSHTAIRLLELGFNVIIFDNLSNSKISTLENIEKITGKKPKFYQNDLTDKSSLKNIFKENKIECVIHFAGLKAVGESCEKPFEYYENNLIGSLNLFEIMEEFGVKNIIFSSSATVYDPNINPPFVENNFTGNTTNPYGTTKLIIENLLRDLANFKKFNSIILRYFNPIGAHKSGLIGEDPEGIPNNLLPFVMKVASGELAEIGVFGDDYETRDGTCERDYIHIMDLVEGHISSLKYLSENNFDGKYEVFNLGTGKSTSVLEIIKIASEVVGFEIPFVIKSRREGDLPISFCNPQKAFEILGWKAQFSVKDAITDSWRFINNKR